MLAVCEKHARKQHSRLQSRMEFRGFRANVSYIHTYPTLPYPTLPYPTLPYPTLPYLPYPTLPYPTLPYPTLPYPTLPYPTLPYPTYVKMICIQIYIYIHTNIYTWLSHSSDQREQGRRSSVWGVQSTDWTAPSAETTWLHERSA